MQEMETGGDLAGRIEAVQSDGVLSAAAKAVMIRLLLRHPEVRTREACPGPAMLAPWLCLTERSVRRAYAELQQFGWLGGAKDRSLQRPILSEADPLTLAEHVASLEWLRDRAVAAGRIGAAVTAEKAAGKVMGFYDKPALQAAAARNVRPASLLPRRQTGEAGRGVDASMNVNVVDQPPPDLPHTPVRGRDRNEGRDLAPDGFKPAPAGIAPALSGSNWHELADLGRPKARLPDRLWNETMSRIKALEEDPEFQAEVAAAPGPEPGSEWAIWEEGLKASRKASSPAGGEASGQKCPPPPAPTPAPSPLRDFVPWNERPEEKPYDPMTW